MSNTEKGYAHLKELDKSKYEIADGESDIRGWTVKNEQGIILGEVDDLILNTESKSIDYLVLNLERNELNMRDRHVLLPLSYAKINEVHKNVIYKGVMANELSALPLYEKGKINRNAIDHTAHVFREIDISEK